MVNIMATLEFIQSRVEGALKKVEKLEKKLERIRKVEAQNWEDPNPYYYSEYDLKCTLRELEDAKTSLSKYQAELQTMIEKANSRDVKAIIDFLVMWKEHVYAWYVEQYDKYVIAKNKYYAESSEYTHWWNYERRKSSPEEIKQRDMEHRQLRKDFQEKWNYMEPYAERNGLNTEKLQKDLENEANAKYDDIIERTNKLIGQITDASYLTVGGKGDLNGIIEGERGKVTVNTIGAGGYNIQCYHFRTLIHKM